MEHREALALVFDQRVALCHRPKTDAVLEVIHLVEVVSPTAVNNRQHDTTLEFTDSVFTQRALADSVLNHRVRNQFSCDVRGYDLCAVFGQDFVHRDRHGEDLTNIDPEAFQVPFIRVAGAARVLFDNLGDASLNERSHFVLNGRAFENLAAVAVDCLTLAVQDVVVLEDVLSDFGVTGLDLGLRGLNRAGHEFRLDGHVIVARSAHNGRSGTRVEQTHEVVLQ